MSNSFKKVVACLIAVLMVTFSVPFTAFAAADTTVYTPDVKLQFGAFLNADMDAGSWVSNFADGNQYKKGSGTAYDLSLAGLSSVQLKATGSVNKSTAKYSVSNLAIEAADTANLAGEYSDWDEWGSDVLTSDYNLQDGDAFTVTVRMDNVSQVSFATAEITYSDNIVPLNVTSGGSGRNAWYNIGTAAQGVEGTGFFEGGDASALYTDIDGSGSEVRTDYDGVNYMYAEVLTGGKTVNWASVTSSEAPDLVNEDGTIGNTYANQSVMTTFAFVINGAVDADHPIEFTVHNGSTGGKTKNKNGDVVFSDFAEGCFSPSKDNTSKKNQTTYAPNKWESGDNLYDGPENFGSTKMTFMGANENVAAPSCQHEHTTTTRDKEVPAGCTTEGSYEEVVTCDDCGEELSRTPKTIPAKGHSYTATNTVAPTCTEQGYTVYTCGNCGDTYNGDFVDAKGHAWGAWTVTTPEVPAECGKAGTTAIETSVCGNDSTHVQTRGGETIPALQHNYVGVVTEPTCTEGGYTTYTCSYCQDSYTGDYTQAKGHAWGVSAVDWNSLDTTTGTVTANYVCANDSEHTKSETVTATAQVIQQQTEDDAEITRFTYTEGEFSDSKDVQTKAPAGHTTHTYTVPVSLDWVGDTTQAKATFKCSKCDETTQYNASVTFVTKSPATCTSAKVVTYTASYDGFTDISKDVTEGQPLGHTMTKTPAVPAGCTTTGTEEYWTCSTCHKMFADEAGTTEITEPTEIPAKGHTPGEPVKENEVAPTATTDGSYDLVTYCTTCTAELSREHVVVPAEGYTITITKHDVGTVTVNGNVVDGLEDASVKVKANSDVVLSTDEADIFQGWESNGKIVSKDATFTTVAYTNQTFTPVYADETASESISVVFYDKFGNEVKAYKNMTPAAYQAAIATDGIPTAQSYPSSKFVEWDTDDNTILGLTTSKTIWAVYEDVVATEAYTVTVQDATGADITDEALTLPTGITKDAVPYDTKVTVANDNAKGWEIDGVTVSTDSSYSFFVGADTTVKMIVDTVEALPTTTIIGANRLADPAYRYNIMATRFIPEGYTLIDYGFVYGKNLTDADLKVENEGKAGTGNNSGNVKVARSGNNSSSNEFALNYGIKSAGNYVTVKSFIVVKKGDTVQTIYSGMESYES